jgi:uncharacterized protein YbjT (DUF2867 family)
MEMRKILIVGATGKQGGSAIRALLAMPPTTPPIHILALTRNVASASAKALVEAHPKSVTLVSGDLKDAAAVFANKEVHKSVSSLFLFTMPGQPEDRLGKGWIDAALADGVTQIVLSTVDRGGDAKSWENPTLVPHFAQKHAIERYLREKAAEAAKNGTKIRWTVLRPTAFMDNLNPGMFCKLFTAMWASIPADKSLQFVSTHDVGNFAAKALASPDEWDQKAFALAGEDMTLAQAKEIFERVVGQPLPQTWKIAGSGLMWAIQDVGKMFAWFGTDGYGADIPALKAMEPNLQNFETWLRESSKWEVKK